MICAGTCLYKSVEVENTIKILYPNLTEDISSILCIIFSLLLILGILLLLNGGLKPFPVEPRKRNKNGKSNRTIKSYNQMDEKLIESLLKEYETFVIVLTSPGVRDMKIGYDSDMDRLNEFNTLIIWEAGHHDFPVIDVGGYMKRLLESDPEEYRSMFRNEMILNDKGHNYIMTYVMKHLRKAYKRN